MSLIIAGATGAIGAKIVQEALLKKSTHIQRIIALTRKKNVGHFKNNAAVLTEFFQLPCDGKPYKEEDYDFSKVELVTLDWEDCLKCWHHWSLRPESLTGLLKDQKQRQDNNNNDEEPNDANASSVDEVKSKFIHYHEIFSGHQYAVMAMGTTRADAGSAEQFIHCDYDYALAFTEMVLMFSSTLSRFSNSYIKKETIEDVDDGFLYHIGDGTHLSKDKKKKKDGSEENNAAKKTEGEESKENKEEGISTNTLEKMVVISSYNADPTSSFLYMKTKGAADTAISERVLRLASSSSSPWSTTTNDKIELLLARPGSLDRGDKARGKEKFLNVFVSSIPVWKCGAAVVHTLQSASFKDVSEVKPIGFEEISKQKGKNNNKKKNDTTDVSRDVVFVFGSSEMKTIAEKTKPSS